MKSTFKSLWLCSLGFFAMLGAFSKPADAQDQSAKSAASNLFDGKSLQGWSGLTANWSVQDGAITGENKADAT